MSEPEIRYCKYCRKPMTSCKHRWNVRARFCSRRCANRHNGKKKAGKPLNRIHTVYTAHIREDKVE